MCAGAVMGRQRQAAAENVAGRLVESSNRLRNQHIERQGVLCMVAPLLLDAAVIAMLHCHQDLVSMLRAAILDD